MENRKNKMTTGKFFLLFAGVGVFSLLLSFLTKGATLCMLNGIFGIPCPSCGMTRAYVALFHGKLGTAFFYHPLFWIIPVIPFFPQIGKKWGENAENRGYLLVIGCLLVVWIVRLLLYFPHREPMLWNQKAILVQIFRFFVK